MENKSSTCHMTSEHRLIDENDIYALFEENGTARLHVGHIDALPRVDAVEVVHGRWERRVVDHELPYYFVNDCSICGCSGEDFYFYCPHCGAKMDGGNEDGS